MGRHGKPEGDRIIPKNISKNDVLKALEEIQRSGVPEERKSRKYQLSYDGRHYPPKYVISLANKYANRSELDSSEFSGGQESNSYLQRLGFQVIESSLPAAAVSTHASEGSRILDLLLEKKQVVLYGPPGTGKTYKALEVTGLFLKSEKTEEADVQDLIALKRHEAALKAWKTRRDKGWKPKRRTGGN